ncbi:MAG: FIST N-terminal domain-containing protein [Planctomycetaceae bacterium]
MSISYRGVADAPGILGGRPEVGSRVGVGFSETPNSSEAGREAARAALAQAGLARCDLALVFATSKHDLEGVRDGVRAALGSEAPLFGGSAAGVIVNDRMGYEGSQVGVAAISAGAMGFDMFIEGGIRDNEHAVGSGLARQIVARGYREPPNLVLLYAMPKLLRMQFNMATPLIAGMTEELGEWPPTMGGGQIADMQLARHPVFQLFGDRIEEQAAMALALTGVEMETIIMHGCVPASAYKTITRAEGNVVLELDRRRATDVVAEAFEPDDTSWIEYPVYITLGINHGDRFGEPRDEDYAVRLCMDIDRERGGLVMFGDDMQEGVEVQVMRRTLDLEYVEARARELLTRVGERRPILGLYIDCAGRAASYCGTEWEEASGVQKVIGSKMPLFGWFVGGEIARAGDVMQSHNWTGILSVLCS